MSLKDNATWKAVKPFMNGGLSGMGATCIILVDQALAQRADVAHRLEVEPAAEAEQRAEDVLQSFRLRGA